MIKSLTTKTVFAALVLLALLQLSGCASEPNPALNLGGIDLEEAFKGQISRVRQILGGINSMDAAEKAKPELEQVSMSIDDLIFNSQKLTPDGQTALSILALKEASDMEDLIRQVNSSPVIYRAIGETMEEILTKIKQLI